MKNLKKVRRVLFFALGVCCILFSEHIKLVLPYLLGDAMFVVGGWMAVGYFHEQKFLEGHSDELAYGIILFIMGIAFVIWGNRAFEAVGITWALIGIRKASKSLNRAICRFHQKQRYVLSVFEFLLRMTLALALLFDPFEKMSTHIVLLGVEMVAISIPFARLASLVGRTGD